MPGQTSRERQITLTCSGSCNEQHCEESACIDFHIVLLYLDISMVCRYLIVIFYETMQLQSQVEGDKTSQISITIKLKIKAM